MCGISTDKSKHKLTEDQKRERKRADLTNKSTRNKGRSERTKVVEGWMVTDNGSLSKVSKYEKRMFQSQKACAKYENRELSDSDLD